MSIAAAASSRTLEPPRRFAPSRLAIGIALVAVFWGVNMGVGLVEVPIFATFMTRAIARLVLLLAFPTWWLFSRSWPWRGKLAVVGVLIVGAVAAALLSRETLSTVGALFLGVPIVFSAWIIWLLLTRSRTARVQLIGSAAVVALAWLSVTLVRMDGLSGDLKADYHWRWSPRAEDVYATERATTDATSQELLRQNVVLARGDWPALRGPSGDARAAGERIATDWTADPPAVLWRQKIGPAWSSPIIVGGRLYTQEQVGEKEAVICLDAVTGRRIWSHEYDAHLIDSQGGPGPRGTPTFADGYLYAQGATGVLSCLDARDGRVRWTRDIQKDAGATRPMWGFSSSPLVVDDLVITYAAGPDDKGLVAYRIADGTPAWSVAAGLLSYSSPELATLAGQRQVLFLDDTGLVSVEPASGKQLWKYEAASGGSWRALQPAELGDDTTVLVGSEDLGLVRLEITRAGDQWKIDEKWKSRAMRPGYNDFVVYDGAIYGFDGSIFCCVDLSNGKRRWKNGRYGHGQVLLVPDQPLLIVTTEQGQAVLVEATPQAHRELGRIQAIEGKTWNHPVLAHGDLYVRNDEEIACYQLTRDTR